MSSTRGANVEEDSRSGATRLSLISRARARQADAWCELIDLYGPLVAHWSRRCGFDSHASADCVQEVFAAVYKSLGSYQARCRAGSFRGWLWTITANKIRDRLRAQRPHDRARGGSSALLGLQSIVDPHDPQDSELETPEPRVPESEPTSNDDLRSLMSRAMEQVRAEFEEKTWQIFIRSVVDQQSTQGVAEQFGVTPATVRKVRSRVMRRLRQQMGDIGD
ncbi:RNA polymerase sigma factor [Planctomycetaceae bacterium SH139]